MRQAVLIGLVVLAGCSKAPDRKEMTETRMTDVSEPPAAADNGRMASPSASAPGISVSAAPGVAFNYYYAFRLPNTRISAVQEEHAQMCEKLGLDRCRITGMRYRVDREDDISAQLSFKLDPTIARSFGKQGIAAIEKAEGRLVNAEITGTDAGAVIEQSVRVGSQLSDELARIEGRLKQAGVPNAERAELTEQAGRLREQLRAASATRTEARASLATTPMVFDYNSGNAVVGNPLREAWSMAVSSFLTMVSFLIIAIGALLPWAILGGFGFWAVRSILRTTRRLRRPEPALDPTP